MRSSSPDKTNNPIMVKTNWFKILQEPVSVLKLYI